jgi:hypothetical protein
MCFLFQLGSIYILFIASYNTPYFCPWCNASRKYNSFFSSVEQIRNLHIIKEAEFILFRRVCMGEKHAG